MDHASAQAAVTDFHLAIGAPVASGPQLLPCRESAARTMADRLRAQRTLAAELSEAPGDLMSRLALALEELAEWLEAHAEGDLVAAADAWGDRQYVLLGDAVAAGLPADAIFERVHCSNMSKADQPQDASGKAVKGTRYRRPELADILQKPAPSPSDVAPASRVRRD